jgi:methylmalonyl-CoA mutase
MADKSGLFSDFSSVSKAEWLQKVQKDLKGKPLESLDWDLEEGIRLSPFFHADDQEGPSAPIVPLDGSNDWEIGETIPVEMSGEANSIAIQALDGGVNALGFELYHPLTAKSLEELLKDIEPGMISINFGEMYAEKHPDHLLDLLIAFVKKNAYGAEQMEGSIDFDPILDWSEPPMELAAQTIKKAGAALPKFKVLQINGTYYHAGDEESSRELALITAKFSAYLDQLRQQGLSADEIVAAMQISVSLSRNYFVEIAKLRALKILLGNVAKAYGCQQHFVPQMVAHLSKESQVDNPNTNMIQATTQAMSAVIGGVDRLYILPANDFKKEPATPFTRRIARNIQHLLKTESFLQQVIDPAVGSYYVEKLTRLLAEKAWTQFQVLEQEGAFSVS